MSQPAVSRTNPEVTIVIPLYRVADYLRDALESVSRQTWLKQKPGSVEILLVIDGECAGYESQIPAELKPILKVLQIPHCVGPYYLKSEGPDKGVYIRFGSTNRIADTETLDSLRLLAKKISYDELPHPQGKLNLEVIKEVFGSIDKHPSEHSHSSWL